MDPQRDGLSSCTAVQDARPPATIPQGIEGRGLCLAASPACSLPVMAGNHLLVPRARPRPWLRTHLRGVQQRHRLGREAPLRPGRGVRRPLRPDVLGLLRQPQPRHHVTHLDGLAGVLRHAPGGLARATNANGWMGPAPSPAHLHQWDERMFPAGTVITRPYPVQGQTIRMRLASAGRNTAGTSLLMLRPNDRDVDPEGRYRAYVEYRGRDGWDRGLHESGTDLARRAVVVHTRTDAPGDGVVAWYRGACWCRPRPTPRGARSRCSVLGGRAGRAAGRPLFWPVADLVGFLRDGCRRSSACAGAAGVGSRKPGQPRTARSGLMRGRPGPGRGTPDTVQHDLELRAVPALPGGDHHRQRLLSLLARTGCHLGAQPAARAAQPMICRFVLHPAEDGFGLQIPLFLAPAACWRQAGQIVEELHADSHQQISPAASAGGPAARSARRQVP